MHPRATNICARARDDYRFGFELAGALEFVNEYSGLAVAPAPILASQNSSTHAPPQNLALWEVFAMHEVTDEKFCAIVGIDWADTKHDICIQPAGSEIREFQRIVHSPQDIEQWALSIRERFNGRVAVVLETSYGPIVHALQKYDFFVLYPVNPAMLAKYREAFNPSGAKDDPTDAELAVDLFVRHPERINPLKQQSTPMRKLSHLVEKRRRLVEDRKRFSNRLISALKQYYPQPVEWFSHKDTLVFCAFITRWPTLKKVKRARRSTLERFFREHRVNRPKLVEERIAAIQAASSLTDDPAVVDPCTMEALALTEQLRVTLQLIKRFDDEIETLAAPIPDYALFSSFPGAGAALAPRLMVAFGEDRERFANAAELQRYTGIAPVTERSGKRTWVHWRWACPTFVRQTFVEWAEKTIYHSYWAGTYYRKQREKGAAHHVATRALAFKWIRILYRCWQSRTPYNETTYLKALERRGAELIEPKSA